MLCGVAASIIPGAAGSPGDPAATPLIGTPVVIGRITGMTGLGADRKAVPNVHNDVTSGWIEKLISCLQEMKPFRVSVVHDSNGTQWKTWISQLLGVMAITWPIERGYTTGGVMSFQAAVTDYTFGSPDIEGRVNAEMTITPSGEPIIAAGAHP